MIHDFLFHLLELSMRNTIKFASVLFTKSKFVWILNVKKKNVMSTTSKWFENCTTFSYYYYNGLVKVSSFYDEYFLLHK